MYIRLLIVLLLGCLFITTNSTAQDALSGVRIGRNCPAASTEYPTDTRKTIRLEL